MNKKLIRITTVPNSLGGLLRGQLKFIGQYFEVIGISSSGNGMLEEVGTQENIRTICIEMSRKITPLQDLRALWKLYRIFKKEKTDIVHTHTPKAGTLGMIAAYFAGVPHRLHTIAGLPLMEANGTKRFILDTVEKITYACATEIYPNSQGLMEFVIEQRYTKPEKMKVIGNGSSNGIDTHYFSPELFNADFKKSFRASLSIKPDDYVFIFVGRLVKDKGIEELVSAFMELKKSKRNSKLLLVGTYEKLLDPLSLDIEDIINTEEDIISVGWQTDVRPYFSISNALVFPSYREGFPNVVMQACAMGLPSVVTNINGSNELIRHSKNGLIVPVKDVEKLKNSMIEIMGNNLTEESTEIRKYIIDNFSRQFVHNEILRNYNSLFTQQNV